MHVFLTGITGWVGSAVNRDLLGAGHTVVGLVRSPDDAGAVAATGATPLVGSLADLDALCEAAAHADGVIHTAFGLDFSDYAALSQQDTEAIHAFAEAFAGTDRPIVVTHGLGLLPAGEAFTEDARPPVIPDYPRKSEQTAFALAERGVRASVVRPARSVHGVGEGHRFVPMLADVARQTGVSAYVGDGASPWPAVHRLDAARLFRLALERGAGGEAYHAVAEGVPFRLVAEAIGRQVGVPTASIPAEEAEVQFGSLAPWVIGGGATSSAWTRETLGWEPREIGLIEDIDRPEYYG